MKTKALQWREILACLKDEALTEAEYAMAAESASAGFEKRARLFSREWQIH
jgi:heme oxygenase